MTRVNQQVGRPRSLTTFSGLLVAAFGMFLCLFPNARAEEQTTDLRYTSPSGAFRVEDSTKGEDVAEKLGVPWEADTWLVSTKDPSQRARLPIESPMSLPDEFHSSPNDEWIFGLWHVGSCLRNGDLFHRKSATEVEKLDKTKSFNELVWENCLNLGALKENYSAEGVCAMTFFRCWSGDSSRILIVLRGGEEKRSMRTGFLYFNTRTNKFELTDYVLKLNKTKSEVLACAEPVDPLPSEMELKTRLDRLDQQLNKTYGEVIAKTQKDRVSLLREGQRTWIKHRDEGVKFYVSFFPQAERERRHLQFMGDVTAARLEEAPEEWE